MVQAVRENHNQIISIATRNMLCAADIIFEIVAEVHREVKTGSVYHLAYIFVSSNSPRRSHLQYHGNFIVQKTV